MGHEDYPNISPEDAERLQNRGFSDIEEEREADEYQDQRIREQAEQRDRRRELRREEPYSEEEMQDLLRRIKEEVKTNSFEAPAAEELYVNIDQCSPKSIGAEDIEILMSSGIQELGDALWDNFDLLKEDAHKAFIKQIVDVGPVYMLEDVLEEMNKGKKDFGFDYNFIARELLDSTDLERKEFFISHLGMFRGLDSEIADILPPEVVEENSDSFEL